MKGKSTGLIILGVVLLIVAIIGISCIGTYNNIVSSEEKVTQALADVDTQLQRRADLIPNLVSTVKGYMKHEETVIDSITSARENLVGAKTLDEKDKANKDLTTAINQLYVVVENYPDLKANTNFIGLQDELAGSENRVAVARKNFNDAVNSYNSLIKKFPSNLIASMFGFEKKDYFEADENAKDVPQVSFE